MVNVIYKCDVCEREFFDMESAIECEDSHEGDDDIFQREIIKDEVIILTPPDDKRRTEVKDESTS